MRIDNVQERLLAHSYFYRINCAVEKSVTTSSFGRKTALGRDVHISQYTGATCTDRFDAVSTPTAAHKRQMVL